MITAIRVPISTLLVLMLAPLAAQAADRAAQCFSPEALAARAGEETPKPLAQKIAPPGVRAGKPVASDQRGVIRRVSLPPGEKLIALTFDLCEISGEIAGYDGTIVDTLRKERVPATFFAGGHWLATHPERARQLAADPLFEIGNHAWSHRLLAGVDPATLKIQVLAPQAQATSVMADVRKACPKAAPQPLNLFRFPAGVCDKRSLDYVNDNGLLAIEWDVVSGDPDPRQSAEAIKEAVLARAKPGSIVVMHANGRGHHTAEALPGLIAALRAKGFAFATVGELLARGKPEIVDHCSSDQVPLKKRPPAVATPTPKPSPKPVTGGVAAKTPATAAKVQSQ